MLQLHSNCVPTTLQLTPTTLQLCYNYIPTTLQLRSNYIPTTLQLCSNYVPTILQLRSNYTPIMLQLRSNYTPTTLQLGSDYTPTRFQLHSNYAPTTLSYVPTILQLPSIFPQGLPSSSPFAFHVSLLWLIFSLLHQLILSMCACIHVESSTGAGKPISGQAPKEKGFPVPSSHRLSLVPQEGGACQSCRDKLIGLKLYR